MSPACPCHGDCACRVSFPHGNVLDGRCLIPARQCTWGGKCWSLWVDLRPGPHSASLPTPLSSVQRPDVRASNPFAAFANLLHVLIAATQYMPVVPATSQSSVPHAQVGGLGAEPSVVAQTGPLRHLFWDR